MLFRIERASDKRKVTDYVERLPEGKRYTVEIKLRRQPRSVSQNRLYWMWVTCIVDETTGDKSLIPALHKYLRQCFLGVTEYDILDGRQVTITRSTKELNTKEMSDYLERIQQFAASELGIVLPNPQDLQWPEFEAYYSQFI